VYHFPLKDRVESLINTRAYADLLQHEYTRRSNPDWYADVYDTPAWLEAMGESTEKLSRIGLLFCIDGVPAFKRWADWPGHHA
jgi:hypothetical protein